MASYYSTHTCSTNCPNCGYRVSCGSTYTTASTGSYTAPEAVGNFRVAIERLSKAVANSLEQLARMAAFAERLASGLCGRRVLHSLPTRRQRAIRAPAGCGGEGCGHVRRYSRGLLRGEWLLAGSVRHRYRCQLCRPRQQGVDEMSAVTNELLAGIATMLCAGLCVSQKQEGIAAILLVMAGICFVIYAGDPK